MIHIESINDDARGDMTDPARPPYFFHLGCFEVCVLLLAVLMIGGMIGGTLTLLRVPRDWAYALGIVGGVAFAVRLYRKGLSENESTAQMLEITERIRKTARRFGYVPPAEGGTRRHRVTITNIDAIWPFDDAALEDLGPGYILRTAEKEHIYCAGDALFDVENYDDGVFQLAETLTLELGGDLQFVLSAASRGRRVCVADDEVRYEVFPAEGCGLGFAILDDPEIIRRLPPIAGPR